MCHHMYSATGQSLRHSDSLHFCSVQIYSYSINNISRYIKDISHSQQVIISHSMHQEEKDESGARFKSKELDRLDKLYDLVIHKPLQHPNKLLTVHYRVSSIHTLTFTFMHAFMITSAEHIIYGLHIFFPLTRAEHILNALI